MPERERKMTPSNQQERRRKASTSRLEQILRDMTLMEKIGQMAQIDINLLLQDDGSGGKVLNAEAVDKYIGQMAIGSVLNTPSGILWNATQFRSIGQQLQAAAHQHYHHRRRRSLEEREMGLFSSSDYIPILWGLDSVHGANYVRGSIVTPQPLNLAATFNRSVALQAGLLASRDTRAAGIPWIFSPVLGLALHPLWSRVYETLGEDPHLVSILAEQLIVGLQQPDADPTARPSRAAATAKHFLGYSMPWHGHDRTPSWIPTRHLYQYLVPPWRRAIQQAQVRTVMESYTEVDGVPMVADAHSLDRLLRRQLQFEGVVLTDYEEVRNLANWHHVRPETSAAVVYAWQQSDSLDMSMIPWAAEEFHDALQQALDHQELSVERLDTSVRRIVKLKEDLHLLDEEEKQEWPLDDVNVAKVGTDGDIVQDMVRQSLILVQNHQQTLPLSKTTPLKVLVTGPTSDSRIYQSGGWTGGWQGAPADAEPWFTYGSTVKQALQQAPTWQVSYRCGTDILGGECQDTETNQAGSSVTPQSILDEIKKWAGMDAPNSIARAVQESANVDVVVVALGEEAYAEKPGDIRSLLLPTGQYDLVKALRKGTSAKIILVYFGGRPRLLRDIVDQVDAIILAFLPGPSAGEALLDLLVGELSPSGRLPITYPMFEDGAGAPYFHSVSDMCTRGDGPLPHYEYAPCEVQWPFGFGLSYTTFAYSNFTASGGVDRDIDVSVIVRNTGLAAGAETVLFFTFDEFRPTTPEYKRLRAFEKVFLTAGEQVTVQLTIPVEDLKFIGPHDAEHYILDSTMRTWIGVGSDTDCRNDNRDATMCKLLQSDDPHRPYNPTCEAACELWDRSGCLSEFGLTAASCNQKCSKEKLQGNGAQGEYGWGWNYVECLESMVPLASQDECWKMTTFCRDTFGGGPTDNSMGPEQSFHIDHIVALVSGILTTILIIYVMRGHRIFRGQQEDRGNVQFTRIRNDDA